jgi:hypothetical protein
MYAKPHDAIVRQRGDKENKLVDKLYIAEIEGYDLNCSTCILHFPEDSQNIKIHI